MTVYKKRKYYNDNITKTSLHTPAIIILAFELYTHELIAGREPEELILVLLYRRGHLQLNHGIENQLLR